MVLLELFKSKAYLEKYILFWQCGDNRFLHYREGKEGIESY